MSTMNQLIDRSQPALFRDKYHSEGFYEFSVHTGTHVESDLTAVSAEHPVTVRILGEVAYLLNRHDGNEDALEALRQTLADFKEG